MNLSDRTTKVRQLALKHGFDACGFARAEHLSKEARRLESWLMEGRQANLGWMEKNFEKRVDPRRLIKGTKTVISVIASYHFPENLEFDAHTSGPKIAKYARGRDYHKVFKQRLHRMFDEMKELIGDIHGRAFVDSAPVLDKVWAERAGLGWIGKNSNLLNREYGSFFLIGEILVDAEFTYDAPATDHCGTCTLCIDACPTNAIYEPYRVDSQRCISYLTIELKDRIPADYRDQLGEWMFGCDICQDVCPWNRKAKPGQIDDLKPRNKMLIEDSSYWKQLSPDQYENLFNGTAVRRAKYPKLKDSIDAVVENLSPPDDGKSS